MLVSTGTAWPDALDNWSTNHVTTNTFRLQHVVHGNGRFVAAGGMGDSGAIMSSEDGTQWTTRAFGFGANPSLVWGLAYGGGRFVAVGHFGGVATSTNGINWSFTNLNSDGLYGVAYGAGRFVAVGTSQYGTVSNIFTSTDGISWTQRRSHPTDPLEIADVVFGFVGRTLRFVAIGDNDGFSYTSDDGGASWIRRSIPGGNCISFQNGRFIVPFGNGTNLISTNAIDWSAIPTGLTGTVGKVIYAGSMYCAVVNSSVANNLILYSIATSADGTNWVMRASPKFQHLRFYKIGPDGQLAFDGRRFITVGLKFGTGMGTDAYIYRSDDIVGLQTINNNPAQIVLTGLEGRSYRVTYSNNLSGVASNWPTLTNVTLTTSPMQFADPVPSSGSVRFYRSQLLP